MKGRQNSIEILKYLISHDDEVVNISAIAKGVNIDYKNTYNIIKQFQKENIVNLQKFGNSNIVKFDKKMNPLIFEAELQRKKEITSHGPIQSISRRFDEFPFPCLALLFGSYAKGTADKHSDIDLLIVADEEKETIIRRSLRILPYDIHSIFLTFDDFVTMTISKEFTVVSEVIKYNIILHGIEQYYNLLSSVKKKYILVS